jgi:hypothetical protein
MLEKLVTENTKKTAKSTLIHLAHCPMYGLPVVAAKTGVLPDSWMQPVYAFHERFVDPVLHPFIECAEYTMELLNVPEKYAHAVAHPLVELPAMIGVSLVVGHYLEKFGKYLYAQIYGLETNSPP